MASEYFFPKTLTTPTCHKLLMIMILVGLVASSDSMRAQSSHNQGGAPVVDPIVQRNVADWTVQQRGVPDDWSHRHLVFSNPGTEQQAIESGNYERWLKVVNDPRFILQQIKRSGGAKVLDGVDSNAIRTTPRQTGRPILTNQPGAKKSALDKDWSEGLGTGIINPNTFPAKWSFSTGTASCANDFVVYPTGLAGSATEASIIAYYNVYSGCGGTVPKVDWAYNTGGTVTLSPVFSLTGNQVALIQTSSSSVASLLLLKYPLTPPGTGTLAVPITPTSVSASAYQTCNAPCMTSVVLNGSPNDTWSSPYYDYDDDTLYVGDAVGKLHKFTPVFNGALAEVTTSPWPAQLVHGTTNDTNPTNGPIYDAASGRVFVGTISAATGGTGGYLYSVGSGNGNEANTSGTIYGASSQLDVQFGIRDSVLVDSNAATVYAFVGNDPSATTGNSGVYQFPTSFTSSTTPSETTAGTGGVGVTAYAMGGTFDNTYYTSANPASPNGYLYLCATGLIPTLYQIPITNNAMGTAKNVVVMGDTQLDGRCSPITEFYNANAFTPTSATGTVTIQTDPNGWGTSGSRTVTIGGTTYAFVTSLGTTANQVLITGNNATNRETRTAQNLRAAVDGVASQCYSSPCFGPGTVANTSVTATEATNVVTLTAQAAGASGDFTLGTNYSTGIALGGGLGQNGTSAAADLIFFSVLGGTESGCTDDLGEYGCILSFNVTTPSAVALSGSGLNVTAGTTDSRTTPTGGLIIDNSVGSGTLAGASQVYFLTTYNSSSVTCTTGGTGVCAVQASQTAP